MVVCTHQAAGKKDRWAGSETAGRRKGQNGMSCIFWFAIIAVVLVLVFLLAAAASLRGKRPFGAIGFLLVALLILAVALFLGTLMVAVSGYRAFTHEELAATIRIEPRGEKRFHAHVIFPDGRRVSYELSGDQVYVDAYLLKWKPAANFLGLHTAYDLDRIGGRYLDLTDEQQSLRTIYSLSRPKPIDLFELRRRYLFLRFLLDAEYGSAAFIGAGQKKMYEIRVSTSGLVAREIQEHGK